MGRAQHVSAAPPLRSAARPRAGGAGPGRPDTPSARRSGRPRSGRVHECPLDRCSGDRHADEQGHRRRDVPHADGQVHRHLVAVCQQAVLRGREVVEIVVGWSKVARHPSRLRGPAAWLTKSCATRSSQALRSPAATRGPNSVTTRRLVSVTSSGMGGVWHRRPVPDRTARTSHVASEPTGHWPPIDCCPAAVPSSAPKRPRSLTMSGTAPRQSGVTGSPGPLDGLRPPDDVQLGDHRRGMVGDRLGRETQSGAKPRTQERTRMCSFASTYGGRSGMGRPLDRLDSPDAGPHPLVGRRPRNQALTTGASQGGLTKPMSWRMASRSSTAHSSTILPLTTW